MIKKVLKKIFPIAFLKQGYLVFNKLRIKTIDKLLFPEYFFSTEDYIIQRDEYPFRLIQVEKSHLDTRLQKQFNDNDTWTQDEYLLIFGQECTIEPTQGWAISTANKLIYPALGFSRAPYVPKPPVKSLFVKTNEPVFEELISLRDTGEENYFHFYNDVLPKLFFLEDKLKLSDQIPVLISKKLYQKPFFQYFLQFPYFKNRKWIIQDKEYIHARKTYLCKPLTHTKKYYEKVLSFVPDFTKNVEAERRIFITRSPKRLRFILNMGEVESVCRKFGFEIIDFDEITLEEQMQIFAQTNFAIGIHGAGLTNMIFRRGRPMSLIEIFPPADYYPFHYILLANMFSYNYDGIIGEKSKEKFTGGFILNVDELENKISKILTSYNYTM